jgi:hypothetical protein
MPIGLILVCRREVFNASFYFDSYLNILAVLYRIRDFLLQPLRLLVSLLSVFK